MNRWKALTGNGTVGPPGISFANGMLSTHRSVDRVHNLGGFAKDVADHVGLVTSVNPVDPAKSLLVLGDVERVTEAEHLANGVPSPMRPESALGRRAVRRYQRHRHCRPVGSVMTALTAEGTTTGRRPRLLG